MSDADSSIERLSQWIAKRLPWLLVLVLGVAVGLNLILQFTANFDQAQLGTFGDYAGGILNPMLSALTIFLLIGSLAAQRRANQITAQELRNSTKELELTRQEMKAARDAHEAAAQTAKGQLALQKRNENIKLLFQLEERYRNIIDPITRQLESLIENSNELKNDHKYRFDQEKILMEIEISKNAHVIFRFLVMLDSLNKSLNFEGDYIFSIFGMYLIKIKRLMESIPSDIKESESHYDESIIIVKKLQEL